MWQEDEDGRQREEDGRRPKDTKAKGCDEASNRNEEKLGKKKRERGRVGPLISSEAEMDESYWPPAASYLHAFVNSRHIS